MPVVICITKLFLNTVNLLGPQHRAAQALPTLQIPRSIYPVSQSSTMCMGESRHGKTDKTQKITLKRKIHRKWDFKFLIKRNFKRRKWKNYMTD